MTQDPIDKLAERLGISSSYRDQNGQVQYVPEPTKRALIAAFGIEAHDAAQALDALDRADAQRLIEPVVVCRGSAREVELSRAAIRAGGALRWTVTLEDQTRRHGEIPVAQLPERQGRDARAWRVLRLPDDLPQGYHRLDLELESSVGHASAAAALIIAPARAYRPAAMDEGARLWGIAVQLYGLRSARNWGIGDFTDLRDLMIWAGEIGAAAVGVNPLHALFLDDPGRCSPYSPSSRRFMNPLYLDIEAMAGFDDCIDAKALMASPQFQQRLDQVRRADLVDYPAVAALKRAVLERLHRALRRREPSDPERLALEDFRTAGGIALERFAVFQALREWHGAMEPPLRDWRRWPPEYRDPDSPAVRAFAAAHAEAIEFFIYLQWQIERQLTRCVEAARDARMAIGLYLDLAVGTDAAGADAWAAPDLVARGASIGAPPDIWNRLGQNWGLPPLNSAALRAQAFQPFAELLRANMRWAGALRIDHVLGLMRLFWIPEGRKPSEGAYVAYPFDELMAVLALESHRNRCLVIGEDLGTLPEGFQPALRSAGALSYCLLYFERDDSGRFRAPCEYPADALVSISTHDLPTLSGYWSETDLGAKEAAGAYPNDKAAAAARESRRQERAGLIDALRREGLLEEGDAGDSVPFAAVLRFIARTPSRMLMIGIEDMLGVRDQANLPGTTDEHPNWRRRLPTELAALRREAHVETAIRVLREERPPVRVARI